MKFNILIVLIAAIFIRTYTTNPQEMVLEGPIVAGRPFFLVENQARIIFQDIGTGQVWEFSTPDELVNFLSWSPSGCEILVVSNKDYSVTPIYDLRPQPLPHILTTNTQRPAFWSPSGEITFSMNENNAASVYIWDTISGQVRLLFSLENSISLHEWLSDTELLFVSTYTHPPDYQVWNTETQHIEKLDVGKYPVYQDTNPLPDDWDQDFYHIEMSPDYQMLLGYYSKNLYYIEMELFQDEEGKFSDLKEVTRSGFDIYFYETGEFRHVKVEDFFIRHLAWSPSGEKIAVTIYDKDEPSGVFVYDVETDELHQVKNDEIVASPDGFEPAWSPDEEWLTVNLKGNRSAIYRISDGETIELSDQFKGTTLYWSPVMDYSETQCSAGE